MDLKKFASTLTGLSLFQAKKKIAANRFRLGKIKYEESSASRLRVLGINSVNENEGSVSLTVSGTNPINFLPSMYQSNDFLRRFLWIAQHIHYDTVSCLDNLHNYFTPLEAPDEFVNWMGSWFSVSERMNLSADKMRIFLQNALRLYRWRGTRVGLENLISIVVGIDIEIYENTFPIKEYMIDETLEADGIITDAFEREQNFFAVHIPLYSYELSVDEKSAIYELIKQEKPVNTRFYVTYMKKDTGKSAGMIIGENTRVQEDGVQS